MVRLKLESSNFCTYVDYIKSYIMDKIYHPLKRSWSGSHGPFSVPMPAIIYPERLKQESPNFGVQVEWARTRRDRRSKPPNATDSPQT